MSPEEFTLILVDPLESLCDEWRRCFEGRPRVEIHNCCFEELQEFDCMVSAANSFGLMDGVVDLAITNYFGPQLMERVQRRILDEYRGEQPIGTSFIIETMNAEHPFLAHTPTMRVPMEIRYTDYVYTAMWAMLIAVWRHNQHSEQKIKSVACPGLGTATGAMPPHEAARQMAVAHKHFLSPLTQINWPFAQTRQNAIGRGGDLGFQR